MKKLILLLLFFSSLSLKLSAQAWEFVGLGLYSWLNADYGRAVEQVIYPYLNCCIGEQVTLVRPDYLYHKYNWNHEEGKREITGSEWSKYVRKSYTVTRTGYGAEAGFFQYGVVFELMRDNEAVYAIISYRHIVEEDALSTIFAEMIPCPKYYGSMINHYEDRLSNTHVYSSHFVRLLGTEQVGAAVFRTDSADIKKYHLLVHVGSNTVKDLDKNCLIVFADGTRMNLTSSINEMTYPNGGPYQMYYSAQIDLSGEEVAKLATLPITDMRVRGIDVRDIKWTKGQKLMNITKALLEK